MNTVSVVFLLLLCAKTIGCDPSPSISRYLKEVKSSSKPCVKLKMSILSSIHGGAFNERYMSIEPPKISNDSTIPISLKRAVFEPLQEASIDSDLLNTGTDSKKKAYAWEVSYLFDVTRLKRAQDRIKPPWDCGETIEWIDLGRDFFPRYVRSVECQCKKCWYNSYVCKPRAFPINVLRRRGNECTSIPEKLQTFLQVSKGEIVEAWIWEEKFVNVNCQCVWSSGH